MKSIDIADQPKLGFGRTVRIAIDGIRYRLFRSLVTVAVIAVAVAFLMNILSESLIKRTVARDARERIARMRLVHDWIARLTTPGSLESILAEVAQAQKKSPIYREIAIMGELTLEQMDTFHRNAQVATKYLSFFENLSYTQRRNLVHTAVGVTVFDQLITSKGLEQFTGALKDIKSVNFVTPLAELKTFLAKWPGLQDQVERIRKGRLEAIRKVTSAREGRPILEALTNAEGTFGETVRRAGFQFDAENTAPEVAAQAQRLLDMRRLEESIEHLPMQRVIARQFNLLPADVTIVMMWNLLRNYEGATSYLEKMGESGLGTDGIDVRRLVWLAETWQEEKALVIAKRRTIDVGDGWMGLGERMGWLLIVSMLVCGIGISNAMLMSVTERFREIATLKCLGALDNFIMAMFVLESSFLGIVGGIFGAVLGILIGLGRMLNTFGIVFMESVPIKDLFFSMMATVGIGLILAAVAAVYPAFKAARLAPMEAMRIE